MTHGAKRTLIARLMAGAGGISGVLGFTMPPTSHQTAELVDFDWFAGGTLLLVLAIYLLTEGAVASNKSNS